MKKLIFLLLMTMSITLTAQIGVRIGYTISELKSEFGYTDWTSGVTELGTVWWSKTIKGTSYIYFLDTDQLVYMCALDPGSEISAQGWIEFMNKNYVIIDEYHWKLYKNGGILSVELVWLDGSLYPFFIFT